MELAFPRRRRARSCGPQRTPGVAIAVVGAGLTASGCGSLDAMRPVTTQGDAVVGLFNLTLVLSLLVFALVAGLLTYVLLRYRRRPGEPLAAPSRVHGNRNLELAWTAGPIITVTILLVLTVQTMRVVASESPSGTAPGAVMNVDVIGWRYWWEYRYPSGGPDAITANELHLPVGTLAVLQVTAGDVIHSYWVPQFGWKKDAIPGKINPLPVQVNQPGVYDGYCTEYCGTQHGWMRIRVVAEPREQFDAWLQALQQPAAAPTTPEAQRGQALFLSNTCVNCHVIRGTPATTGRVGPELTHIGSRSILGSGVVENTPETLYRFIYNVHDVKPGVQMPSYASLPEADMRAIAAYLSGLK